MTPRRRTALLLAGAVVGVLASNVWSLSQYPAPSCDEVSYSSTVTSFLSRGQFGWSPVFTQGDVIGRDVNWVPQGRLFSAGMGLWFLIVGEARVPARAYSLAGGLVAALLLQRLGRCLYGRRVGAAAALLFATSASFLLTSHLARPDIWLAAFGLLALLAVDRALRADGVGWSAIAGLAAGAATDIHGNGLCVLAAATATMMWLAGWRAGAQLKVAAFAGGATVALAAWVALHVWPSPASAWAQFDDVLARTSFSTGPAGWLGNLLTIREYAAAVYGWRGKPWIVIEVALTIAGLSTALSRRTRSDVLLLVWALSSFLTFAVFFSQRFANYHILFSPVLILLGVTAVEAVATHMAAGWQRAELAPRIAAWTIAALVAVQLAGNLWVVSRYSGGNFDELNQAMAHAIPPGARVLADPNWWWMLRHERVFITDEYLASPRPASNAWPASPSAMIARLAPDFVVVDDATSCHDQGGPGHDELLRYVASRCVLVATLTGAWAHEPGRRTTLLGQVSEIYKCTSPPDQK